MGHVLNFENYCDNGIFTLKFHLLYHLSEEINLFVHVEYLDDGASKYFNVEVYNYYGTTSMWHATRME